MEWLQVLILAFALSLDGFGAGVAYGVKPIRLPWKSLAVISLCSMGAMALSMVLGQGIATYLQPGWTTRLGGGLMILLGLWQLWGMVIKGEEEKGKSPDDPLFALTIRPLGIVVQVLREPSRADFDHSGEINGREALLLGLALGLDALGAGFGASLAGIHTLWLPVVTGLVLALMVDGGIRIGRLRAAENCPTGALWLPGTILCLLGIYKML